MRGNYNYNCPWSYIVRTFFLVNIFYDRTHSRSLVFNKGLINISPNLSIISFLIISSGMASPPTLNLLREFLISFSLLYYYHGFIVILFFILIIRICYSIYWYSFNLHGKLFTAPHLKCLSWDFLINLFILIMYSFLFYSCLTKFSWWLTKRPTSKRNG